MNDVYGRNLDLNLLRVLLAVADTASVTQAASQLYLTQPAVSAALRRLNDTVGAPLFVRQGRGLVLTDRGARLVEKVRPNLQSLLEATLAPPTFDPKSSDRVLRLGLSDSMELWLVPGLLRAFETAAPRMRLVVLPVQFRTVGEALALRRIDAAVTVADELPPSIRREPLYHGGFSCLYDPRHARLGKKLTERTYFEHDHVIVSYNGDMRGVVEDALQKTRRVRCSVASFASVGAIVDGTSLLATLPSIVAAQIRADRPHLRTTALPFRLASTAIELLWPAAADDDDAGRLLRGMIVDLMKRRARGAGG